MLVSINKVLLALGHPQSSIYAMKAKPDCNDMDHMAPEAKNNPYLSLYRKHLPTPALATQKTTSVVSCHKQKDEPFITFVS